MRWLLFLSRTAFICNLFFIACVVLRYTDTQLSQGSKGFIIIVGYPLSIVLNVVVNLMVAVFVIKRRQIGVPVWLLIINMIIFLVQIVYLSLF